MIKGILFDKDDTLIDLETFWLEPIIIVAKNIAQKYGQNNKDIITKLIAASGFDGNNLISDSPLIAGTNLDVVKAFSKVCSIPNKDFSSIISMIEENCIKYGKITGNDKVENLIKALNHNGYILGVVTSDNKKPTIHCLKELGIMKYFKVINSADCFKSPKPFPDMGLDFLNKTSLCSNEVVMVGDCLNDMRFAKNCGFFGVLYNKHNIEKIKKNENFYEINNLSLLPEVITILNKRSYK